MTDSIKYTIFRTKWGYFGLAADNKGLLRTVLPCPDRKIIQNYLFTGLNNPVFDKNLLKTLQRKIIDYFEGKPVEFTSDIRFAFAHLGAFMKKTLLECGQIPYGKTVSYSQLARRLGKPLAARAVGSALAKNPVPLLIPCHRVIHSDGSAGNFSAFINADAGLPEIRGIALKLKLLRLERAV